MLRFFTLSFLVVFIFNVSTRLEDWKKPFDGSLGFECPVVDLVAKRGETWEETVSFLEFGGSIVEANVEGIPGVITVEDFF